MNADPGTPIDRDDPQPPIDRMSASLSDMRLPRGRLLVIENGVEVEIEKREIQESKS